jgi:aspartyl-tRNA(Asn)/glutamyl-tRNA(Gln) amidotransferase subunit A
MDHRWTARRIRDAVARGETSAVDVCQFFLDRIAGVDSALHAFHTVPTERALARAADLDRRRRADTDLPLLGVPVAVKDNICTRGVRTTASSRMLERFVPPYDATVVTRLEQAGAIVIGKTICDEFAMGSSTEYSAFGPSCNPWDPGRTPGGSSGGSAVAVAAGLAPIALGSDTGGSVVQPAALCGVVGLRPTYGRVSRYGLIAFASSLDQIGPMTRSTEDAALLLGVIAGRDPCDATSRAEPVPDFAAALGGDLRGARIGVPRRLLAEGVDEGVIGSYEEALGIFSERGATIVEVDLPHARYAIPVYYLVATAEASSNLARYDGVRYGFRAPTGDGALGSMYRLTRDAGFGAEVKRRIMLGTYALSAGYYDAYYRKAQQVRTLIRRDYEAAFERVDAVALPTSPTAAFSFGEKTDDPIQMYLADVFTVSAGLAGLPAISVPMRPTPEGLPLGLELMGRALDEATLLRIADAFERDQPWAGLEPPYAIFT